LTLKALIALLYFYILLFYTGCTASVDETILDFGSTEISKTFTITEQGVFEWNISCNENWVTITPDHGKSIQTITNQTTSQKINVTKRQVSH